MDEPILIDVEVSGAGTATPVIGLAGNEVLLEAVQESEVLPAYVLELSIDSLVPLVQRLQLALPVVDDTNCSCESELGCSACNHYRVLRLLCSTSDDRIDIHAELGESLQQHELLVEDLQALLRHVVRHHVVDGDLKRLKARRIESLYPLLSQQVPVGQ